MKKQLLKLGAICVAFSFASNVSAQVAATIKNLGTNKIVIDGKIDAVWDEVDENAIDKPYGVKTVEAPSVTAYWKAAWTADGVYVLIDVKDDVWYPSWVSKKAGWESDMTELYFDVSNPQKDGKGGKDTLLGNWQIAPNFVMAGSGKDSTLWNGTKHCSTFDTKGNYTREYFVTYKAFSLNGVAIDPTKTKVIGFDVTVADNDGTGRNRAVWSNIGTKDECWNNMDDAGALTFGSTVIDLIGIQSAEATQTLTAYVANEVIKFNMEVDSYQLYNVAGQRVASDLKQLNPGMYVVSAKVGNKNYNVKIIK